MSTATTESAGLEALAGKYLTFSLGNESYGVPVLSVREIIRLAAITAVPQMPEFVKGVVNLRGKVIPVVDLRIKFGLRRIESTERTCIVVVQVDLGAQNKTLMGLIVDGVEEVAQIQAQDIEATPDFGSSLDTAYILGIAKIKNAVKALLDINRVIAADALATIREKTAGTSTTA